MTKVSIEFEFEVVGAVSIGADAKLRFPTLSTDPGVYRFRLLGHSGATSAYIGETDNLRRRATHYRNPGPSQSTNIRMNARIRSHLDSGGAVEFAILTGAALTIAADTVRLDLSRKEHRRLLENAALISNPNGELIENLL